MAHSGRRSQAKALQQHGRQDTAYRVLAYKFFRIIADGNITDVGIITMEMIEIGKNGYLIALQNSKVI